MSHSQEVAPTAGRYRLFNTIGCTLVVIFSVIGLFTAHHDHDGHAEDTTLATDAESLSIDENEKPLDATAVEAEAEDAQLPNLWQLGSIPFVLLLLSIAVLPLISSTEHWWHINRHKLFTGLVLSLIHI